MLHKPTLTAEISRALDAAAEAARFKVHVAAWHRDELAAIDPADTTLLLHRSNYNLWHLEDAARDPRAGDSVIADTKRKIDAENQRRNNLAEQIDRQLMAMLASASLPELSAPLHSETPGMMLDRLSILSLKIFHTAEEVERADASADHATRNRERLAVLEQQSADLLGCLAALWHEVCQGTRRFALYRQMKMYNDPELNPVLYKTANGRSLRSA